MKALGTPVDDWSRRSSGRCLHVVAAPDACEDCCQAEKSATGAAERVGRNAVLTAVRLASLEQIVSEVRR